MKTKLKLSEFFEYVGITYDDDMSEFIHYEYENYSVSDVIYNLPKQFKLTEKQLEKCSELQTVLNGILNTACRDSLVVAAYDKQREMIENVMEDIVKYVNKVENNALNNITIDWDAEEAIIDFNTENALTAIREIINAEGKFEYTSNDSLACVYDGQDNPTRAVEHHLHYLLKIKLIDSIYGFIGKPNYEWEVSNWDMCPESVSDAFDELSTLEHDMLSGKIHFSVYLALIIHQRVKIAESELKTLRKEAYNIRKTLSEKELEQYFELESKKCE